MTDKPDSSPGLDHLSEDTTGFGRRELRTVRDAFVRPAAMLEAYMNLGPTGGGEYARPLRFYFTLCGILMLQLFLMGGATLMLGQLGSEVLDPLIARSGKSRDVFLSDADNWMSLVLVPINAVLYALASAPLLRWWDPENLGWRRAFRGTFHYLNVWTLPFVPIGFLAYMPATAGWMSLVMVILSFIAFLRIGKGRWYRSTLGGVVKAAVLTLATFLAALVAYLPTTAIGLLGGVLG
ncbi:hypothetical protein Q0812_01405 [Brevundimonas sp. 2R-24]|uniref:Yip1 domain-containing protein n=1 Tax=Peiella sedimenti TaxID=3061083 RepID=A0ABT8SHS7_9CAUL|nr:hypothetical protein [Caulobacteraceae bacterium XZ-24]